MQNEEVSDDDAKVRFPPRTIWISFAILLSMLTITIIWFKVANDCDWSKVSLGDIGAILSGTFTALAWYWFIEAYLLQSKELTLQRKTLETQVEELKQSVIAQKGSEAALKEQSKALKAQLAITEQQFTTYLEEYEGKKPLFILLDEGYNQLKIQRPTGNGRIEDIGINSKIDSNEWSYIIARCYFSLKNIGGEFSLIDIEATSNSKSNLKSKISATCRLNPSIRAGFTAYSIELSLRNSSYGLSPQEFINLAIEVFSEVTLNFQYQYSNTSSSNLYQLKIDDAIFTLEKLI